MGVKIMRRGGVCRIDLTHGIGDQLHPTANWEAVHGLGRTYARPYGAGWFWQVRDLLIRGGAPGNDAGSRSERA